MAEETSFRGFRFGVFEVDSVAGELRRQGLRIKLHAQPLQVLTMLLSRPGEVLTREEIAAELWTEGTFVDAEHGVNSAVNRIREALGDTARNPRFVETLARRGYRFVAPVEPIRPPGSLPHVAAGQTSFPVADTRSTPPAPDQQARLRVLASSHDLPEASPRVVRTLFLLFQAMYLAFYVGALANLAEIGDLLAVLPYAEAVLRLVIASAAVLIPARAFLACAAVFHPPQARTKLLQLWPLVLVADLLWALSPFLLLHHINSGLALACTALLVYSPFAERSLVLMGAADSGTQPAAKPT